MIMEMEVIRMNIKNNKNCKITINDEVISVSEKEKKADELFKELGYKKNETKFFSLRYTRQCNIVDGELEHIIFTKSKKVKFQYQYTDISKGIDMQELQAINKKCRELRLDMMNKCKYITIRTKNYEKYFYCRLNKKIINYTTECIKCVKNEPRKNKGINKVSKKRITVTKETYDKVIERDDYKCRLCGATQNLQLHHIYGRGKDLTNDINNCIMLCRHCHLEVVHKNQKNIDHC